MLAIIVSLVIILLGVRLYMQNQKPQVELGVENGKFKEISTKPNGVSTQTSQEEKRVAPLALKENVEASKVAMKKAFAAYEGIEIKEETSHYIYAVATTGKMKFHDDIEVYFDENANHVGYRSASRAGYSDMGLNKTRYEAIAKLYTQL